MPGSFGTLRLCTSEHVCSPELRPPPQVTTEGNVVLKFCTVGRRNTTE